MRDVNVRRMNTGFRCLRGIVWRTPRWLGTSAFREWLTQLHRLGRFRQHHWASGRNRLGNRNHLRHGRWLGDRNHSRHRNPWHATEQEERNTDHKEFLHDGASNYHDRGVHACTPLRKGHASLEKETDFPMKHGEWSVPTDGHSQPESSDSDNLDRRVCARFASANISRKRVRMNEC